MLRGPAPKAKISLGAVPPYGQTNGSIQQGSPFYFHFTFQRIKHSFLALIPGDPEHINPRQIRIE